MNARPLVLVGPTGAGKTDLALAVAERFGAEVVSMDAMQVYRGLDVGTAKVSPAERARVPHHGIDIRDPDEVFTAADFVALAEAAEAQAAARGRPIVLCGGTTFYLQAWWVGLVPVPPVDPALRAALEAEPEPHRRLAEVDPELAARLHPNDRVRVVRGLEVYALTGRPLSALHREHTKARRPSEVVWVDVEGLEERLDRRVDAMMAAGYLEEVRGLLDAGWAPTLKPMLSLGYKHLASHLLQGVPLDEAVEATKRATRQLARKQRMWLRGQGLHPAEDPFAAAARAFGGARISDGR